MNPSVAAEWRPDTNAARGDSLAHPSAAAASDPSPPPPAIFQRLSNDLPDLATLSLSFVADVPFEVDETNFRCNLTHTLPVVSKSVRSLVSSDGMWRAGLERMISKEPTWREATKKICAENASRNENAAGGNNDNNRTTYEHVGTNSNGQRVYVGVQEVGMEDNDDDNNVDDEDMEDAANGADGDNNVEEESIQTMIDKACKALSVGGVPCTCKQLFRRIVQAHLSFRSPIFYMPGPVSIGQSFGLHFFEPRYRLFISEVLAPYPVAFRRGDPIQLEGSGHRHYPKFIYANHSPLERGAPAVIVEVRQCLINPNGTADVFLCPTAYIWLEDIRERPNSGALYDARAIRMTEASAAALERQAAEAEARRMAQEAAMFTGGNADLLFALMQQLGGGGQMDESDEESDDGLIPVD